MLVAKVGAFSLLGKRPSLQSRSEREQHKNSHFFILPPNYLAGIEVFGAKRLSASYLW
jgi:hypothetical protein